MCVLPLVWDQVSHSYRTTCKFIGYPIMNESYNFPSHTSLHGRHVDICDIKMWGPPVTWRSYRDPENGRFMTVCETVSGDCVRLFA
jgi:hypothetical protein